MESHRHTTASPESTFALGKELATRLAGGEAILLHGELGAGKTLLTKGILDGLDFDADEVSSPSFTLVNLYQTPSLDVYHIDLWRIDPPADAANAVGLSEILENPEAVVIIEWAEKLGSFGFHGRPVIEIEIRGDGDEAREFEIEEMGRPAPKALKI